MCQEGNSPSIFSEKHPTGMSGGTVTQLFPKSNHSAQHLLFSADLELNAVLTIRPVSVTKIPVVGCRRMIAV